MDKQRATYRVTDYDVYHICYGRDDERKQPFEVLAGLAVIGQLMLEIRDLLIEGELHLGTKRDEPSADVEEDGNG